MFASPSAVEPDLGATHDGFKVFPAYDTGVFWPPRPVILELNIRPWLRSVGASDLAHIPEAAWAHLPPHVDALWLMGVWQESEQSRAQALIHHRLQLQQLWPDLDDADVRGSPYAIRSYQVEPSLGGEAALADFRENASKRGLRLILDYVPNHVALDHPWVDQHPDWFVQGDQAAIASDSEAFFAAGSKIIAKARDPYFPPWSDVAQVHAFSAGARAAARDTLLKIAGMADGVRCDMAMLLLDDVFRSTWGERAGDPLARDFWQEVLPPVYAQYPDFLTIAEVYWNREAALLERGFKLAYDKDLYDHLRSDSASAVNRHLLVVQSLEDKLLRFLENHDEPRARASFPKERLRAALVALLTLPGAVLLHQGQAEGLSTKQHLFSRRPWIENTDSEVLEWHEALLHFRKHFQIQTGRCQLLKTHGWPEDQSHQQLLCWAWETAKGRALVIINHGTKAAYARIRLPWPLGGQDWLLRDPLQGARHVRSGDELTGPGLFVGLAPWAFHLFLLEQQ